MRYCELAFPFFTHDELRRLAPDLLEMTTDRPLLVGGAVFYLARRIAERFTADGVCAESSEVLYPAGSYLLADANGDQWDVSVTTAQRGLLLHAAYNLGTSEANVMTYVAGFTDIPLALHYDDWSLATPWDPIPASAGKERSFREHTPVPPQPFAARASQ
ncbi:hypothetical protein [Microbacterium nymphoidis]|uniref:hypothetical protein n=1 Tax=Microbacterium nymphoidis TaxID=2898586 RepID=UPI001E55C37D|nr:hypothetical protein [Microbacterium nymphoidis]MCD2498499.1 hypothetical protein [Microbacterium nymphoidis]